MSINDIIKNSYILMQKVSRVKTIQKNYNTYRRYIRYRGMRVCKLTYSQKKEVDAIYRKYGWKYSYATHELYLTVTGEFDPLVFPEDLFRTTIEYALNNQAMRAGWGDKNYFDMFVGEYCFPTSIVRNINGTFYDRDYRIISGSEAVNCCLDRKEFVIKPSTDSGFGRNVEKAKVSTSNEVRELFAKFSKNYLVQELVDVHPIIKGMNANSVSVMRVNTLFVNGVVSVLSATFRIGTGNDFKDLQITAKGDGFVIAGIDLVRGCIKDKAYYQNGAYCEILPNGFNIQGLQIPNWEKLLTIVTEAHKRMAHFGYIGWDITIDKKGNPVVIEYNHSGPGVLYYQYCNGPLFGERTTEVLEYVKQRLDL